MRFRTRRHNQPKVRNNQGVLCPPAADPPLAAPPTGGGPALFECELADWPTVALLRFHFNLTAALERTRLAHDLPARNAALRLIVSVEEELSAREL